MGKHRKFQLSSLVLILFAALVLLPMVFVLVNSFMDAQETAARYTGQVGHYVEPTLWPDKLSLSAYEDALLNDPATTRLFLNSVLLTVPILLGQLVVSPLAAYAFEMAKFKGKEVLYTLYVVVMLMPMQLLMVPHYITAELLGYNNTWWAIILPAVFAPFGTFLMRQQMKGVDRSQLEAARIEGANEWQVFCKAVMPTVRSTMAALAILTFADCWNLVDQAVVFIKNTYDVPLSVYLSELASGQPGLICATACVYMFPAVLLFLWGHDSVAHGIALSSMEGKA